MDQCAACGNKYSRCHFDNNGDLICDNCWILTCQICGNDDITCSETGSLGTMMCDNCYVILYPNR